MKKEKIKTKKPPFMFRPLLWYLNWSRIDIVRDKEDIIVNTINDGTLAHWRWIVRTYGKAAVRAVLKKRMASEFHPESLKLATIWFSLPPLRYAR